jgi:hypothetical protein
MNKSELLRALGLLQRGVMFSRWDVFENEDGSWGTVYCGDYAPEFDDRRYRTKKEAKRALRRLKEFSGESDWRDPILKGALTTFIIGVVGSIFNVPIDFIFVAVVVGLAVQGLTETLK